MFIGIDVYAGAGEDNDVAGITQSSFDSCCCWWCWWWLSMIVFLHMQEKERKWVGMSWRGNPDIWQWLFCLTWMMLHKARNTTCRWWCCWCSLCGKAYAEHIHTPRIHSCCKKGKKFQEGKRCEYNLQIILYYCISPIPGTNTHKKEDTHIYTHISILFHAPHPPLISLSYHHLHRTIGIIFLVWIVFPDGIIYTFRSCWCIHVSWMWG